MLPHPDIRLAARHPAIPHRLGTRLHSKTSTWQVEAPSAHDIDIGAGRCHLHDSERAIRMLSWTTCIDFSMFIAVMFGLIIMFHSTVLGHTCLRSPPSPSMPSALPPALSLIVEHVLLQRWEHVARCAQQQSRPLVVGIQGPQGSGKSFLSSLVREHLASSTIPGLRVAVVSVDDFYLPHADLKRVAEENPSNPLLQGRGQPGTHDIELGTKVLHALRDINNQLSGQASCSVRIPFFDKSLHGGEGDRVPEGDWTAVCAPLDMIIFEGWFVGFCPCSSEELNDRYNAPVRGLEGKFDLQTFCKATDITEINAKLAEYQAWWSLLDAFVQLSPQNEDLTNVYKWRLQQEHSMKAKNGGKGMSDEQVARYVQADGLSRSPKKYDDTLQIRG
jgi:D-glycerate 3-kinase